MFVLIWFNDRKLILKIECQSMAKNDGYCKEKERWDKEPLTKGATILLNDCGAEVEATMI